MSDPAVAQELDHDAALAFAVELADVADRISLAAFGGPMASDNKADGSPVTEVDQAIEAELRQRIVTAYPDHVVLGEEQGGALASVVPTWVLDPIDGTANYLRGIEAYATLIAVAVDGVPVVGVVSAPAMGERWEARRGRGARHNGELISVTGATELAEAQLFHGGLVHLRQAGLWAALGRLVDAAWRTRGFGDYWMHLLVAAGMGEAAFEVGPKPWDLAALACIVDEAGGRMTRFDGGDVLAGGGGVLTTNGALHEQVRPILAAEFTEAAG
jgi:histidinol-phosphatase